MGSGGGWLKSPRSGENQSLGWGYDGYLQNPERSGEDGEGLTGQGLMMDGTRAAKGTLTGSGSAPRHCVLLPGRTWTSQGEKVWQLLKS